METHSGNGAAKEPVALKGEDKRWPLSEVTFSGPTKVSGCSMMLTTLEAGVNRLVDGKEWSPPPMWFDPVNRVLLIGDYTYPIERVHCMRRAKLAITKKPAPMDLSKFHIGKIKK